MDDCNLVPDRIYSLQDAHLHELRQRFADLFAEASKKRFGYQNMVASHLMSILVQIGRCVKDNANVAQQSRKCIEKAVLYIQGNFSDSNLTIANLAERAHLSESRFRELFRESQGVSPCEYLTQTRITNACNLLETTGLSISHIARRCGYEDIAYFSRIFRQKIGVSPTIFRKSSELL